VFTPTLPISHLQAQLLTTSEIRSRIEHLMRTYNILVLLLLHSVLTQKSGFILGSKTNIDSV